MKTCVLLTFRAQPANGIRKAIKKHEALCNMGNHAYGHRLDDLQAVRCLNLLIITPDIILNNKKSLYVRLYFYTGAGDRT